MIVAGRAGFPIVQCEGKRVFDSRLFGLPANAVVAGIGLAVIDSVQVNVLGNPLIRKRATISMKVLAAVAL